MKGETVKMEFDLEAFTLLCTSFLGFTITLENCFMIFLPAGVITKRDFSEKDHEQWLMSFNGMTFTKSQR